MPEIQTWMKPADDKYTMVRAKYTAEFMSRFLRKDAQLCLDIGGMKNMVGDYITDYFRFETKNTEGNLDWDYSAPKNIYDVVICLEMMEHLTSPGYFLWKLKEYINQDTQIFFTYPSRPCFLWTHQHFHEYKPKRFRYLLKYCGYYHDEDNVVWERKYFPEPLKSRLRGVRPFLRQFVNFDNLVYTKLRAEQ